MTRIRVGTCSWSDHTDFYPPGLPSNQQLSFYADHFPVVEINSTFYHMLPERNFRLWADRTPPEFVFDVKPYQQLTWHDRKNPPDEETSETFRQVLQPLRDANKLGAINFQFPPWYVYLPENIAYIRQLRERFPEDRLSVEFRNRSWMEPDRVPGLLDVLREARVALTVVDEPQVGSGSVPTLLNVTMPDLALVRFHGRNAKMWYAKVARTADRFDYLYSDEELREWVPNVAHLAEHTEEIHLLFNNNRDNFAVLNAHQLELFVQEAMGADSIMTV